MLLTRVLQGQRRRFSEQAVVHSSASRKAPLTTRFAWFSYGLNFTLLLGLYQLAQDASEASKQLDAELARLREDTASTQRGLRAKIAKLEQALGATALKLEEEGQKQ